MVIILTIVHTLYQDLDVDVFELVEDFGFDEATINSLTDAIIPDQLHTSTDPLLRAMADLARHPANIIHLPSPDNHVYKCTPDVESALDCASSTLRDQTLRSQFKRDNTIVDSTMDIRYDSTGRATSAVVTIIPCPGMVPNTAAQTIVVPGQPMPYIRLPDDQRPSVSATVELHQLSSEQEFAFRLIMDTMHKHLAKESDIPQLTMSVLGSAGKSIDSSCIDHASTMHRPCIDHA